MENRNESSQDNPITEEQVWAQLSNLPDVLTELRNKAANYRRWHEAGETVNLSDVRQVLGRAVRSIENAMPPTDDEMSGPQEYSVYDLLASYWDQVKNRKKTAGTGFVKLDDILSGGFEPQRLVGILGAPNTGKTTFAHQLADHIADSGRPVLYVTSEDTPSVLFAKTLARIGQIPYKVVLKGWESERTHIDAALTMQRNRRSSERMRYLDATNGATLREIRNCARAHFEQFSDEHQGGGPGVLVVDYLQRIARALNRNTEADLRHMVTETTNALRSISYELNCTVVAIASQNRQSYQRGEQGAMASAKESGDIEYTCDVLIALNEDKDKNRVAPLDQTPIKLYVDKNRQGQRGKTVDLNFWPDRQQFTQAED